MEKARSPHAAGLIAIALALGACSSQSRDPGPEPGTTHTETPAPPQPAADASGFDASVDALSQPLTLEGALMNLEAIGRKEAARIIKRRHHQTKAKMKLSEKQAADAAVAVFYYTERSQSLRSLHDVMPHSTIELCRAVAERGVPLADANAIAGYLLGVVDILQPGRLAVFDRNHSHVTGRDWEQIDYSGENMTWESQKKYWAPRGVISFKKAEYIHAYFVGAENMKHFARVYRPAGKMKDVPAP